MKTSEQGIDLLIGREALRTHAYQDSTGVWTIGVGHVGPDIGPGLVWTEEYCKEVFAQDLQRFEDAVNKTMCALTQNEFDALVSFSFNVGTGAFLSSTMKRELDAGTDHAIVAEQFDRWHIPPEITSRRNGEKAQFLGTAYEPRIPA